MLFALGFGKFSLQWIELQQSPTQNIPSRAKILGKQELLDHFYYPAVLPMRDYTGQQNIGFFNPLYCAANLEAENPGISVKQAPPDLQL